jgi:hypothetical protein
MLHAGKTNATPLDAAIQGSPDRWDVSDPHLYPVTGGEEGPSICCRTKCAFEHRTFKERFGEILEIT